jgi:hypothetical protein
MDNSKAERELKAPAAKAQQHMSIRNITNSKLNEK